MLAVHDISFSYPGAEALFEGLTLTAGPREVIAVIGRNGAGKSTFLRLLNGILRPGRGDILIDGSSTLKLKINEIASLAGTLFQTPEQQLFAATVHEEVCFGPRQFGLDDAAVEHRVRSALKRCGLQGLDRSHPLDLGFAERRFAALASVLANQPKILLLDEPQRGLDRIWTERLEGIVQEERQHGRVILLVCHDMDFVLRNATSVMALGINSPRLIETEAFFHDEELVAQARVEMPARFHLKAALAGTP